MTRLNVLPRRGSSRNMKSLIVILFPFLFCSHLCSVYCVPMCMVYALCMYPIHHIVRFTVLFFAISYIHGCGTFISTWKVQCQVLFCLVEVFHSVRTFTGSTHTRVSRIKLVLYLKIQPPTKRTVRLFRMSDSFRIRISCDKVSYLGNDHFPPLVQQYSIIVQSTKCTSIHVFCSATRSLDVDTPQVSSLQR